MLTIALVLFLVFDTALVAVILLASFKPKTFRWERSTTIRAAASSVWSRLEDFRAWGDWSPWEKLDPAMVKTYDGAERGVGAKCAWKGNRKAGEGRMEIVEAHAPEHMAVRLEFLKPFAAINTAEFLLQQREGETRVTWSMHGPMAFPMRVASVFVDIEAKMAKDFDEGLASLKEIGERG